MPLSDQQLVELAQNIKQWATELGFTYVGISDLDLTEHEQPLLDWLDKNYHGEMEYMQNHGLLRARPAELHPGSVRSICIGLDYLPQSAKFAQTLKDNNKGYISRYSLGRDYHKLIRNKLKQLGQKIEQQTELNTGFRPFVDSAPILERPLAEKAGIGWTGKHTLILNETGGSWFFLGELLINLPLPTDTPVEDKCGNCVACMTICPTQAIVAPYEVDARRCISYLTIEKKGPIPEEFRQAIGNRIYGCDDCQLVCPWNRFASLTAEDDFQARHNLDSSDLVELWNWQEHDFLTKLQGSAIRRIGYEYWLRNIAIALGNAPASTEVIQQLQQKLGTVSELVDEHINWALEQQQQKMADVKLDTGLDKKTQRLVRVVEKGLGRDA